MILYAMPHVNNFRTYIDIGAHNGNTCIDFVDKFKRVYAFEPNPETVIQIPNTIKTFPFALGNKREERVLTIPDNDPKHGSIVRHMTGQKQFSITVRTLDGFEFKEVDLIKIDVEGMELEVLEGSIQTIMKWRPVVLFKYNEKLVDFFKQFSYNIKQYKSDTVAYYE